MDSRDNRPVLSGVACLIYKKSNSWTSRPAGKTQGERRPRSPPGDRTGELLRRMGSGIETTRLDWETKSYGG